MMARHALAALSIATLLVAATSTARAQDGNPFASGGPLAPWRGPITSLSLAPVASATGSTYIPGLSGPTPSAAASVYVPGLGSAMPGPVASAPPPWQQSPQVQPVQRDVAAKAAPKQESRTYVSAIANPALLPWGRMAARIEVAPFAAHAVFFEFAKWDLAISYEAVGQTVSRQVPIYEYGGGYHLYPQGRGVSGFYLGPRFIYAKGETDEAVGTATAWGADVGYQFVVARHLVFNLGIGVVHLKAEAKAKPGYVSQVMQAVGGDDTSLAGKVKLGQSVEKWLPLPTAGLGIAF
jgi:hypothetical protein